MKNQLILKSLFALALIVTMSPSTHASEIIGNLSGGGVSNDGSVNGSIGGTVSGGSTNSGGGSSSGSRGSTSSSSGNTGVVLGASTDNSNSPTDNSVSSDGKALAPRGSVATLGDIGEMGASIDTNEIAQVSTDDSVPQTATAVDAISGFSTSNWIWIILLVILLIASVVYLYSRSLGEKNRNRIP